MRVGRMSDFEGSVHRMKHLVHVAAFDAKYLGAATAAAFGSAVRAGALSAVQVSEAARRRRPCACRCRTPVSQALLFVLAVAARAGAHLDLDDAACQVAAGGRLQQEDYLGGSPIQTAGAAVPAAEFQAERL